MIVDKKYLSPEYLASLSIGIIRYDPLDRKNTSLISIGNFLNYFFITKTNSYSILSKVFETENLVYLKIFGFLISFKLTTPNMEMGDIKQELINKLENTIDNNSFGKAHKFIEFILNNLTNDKFNNSTINIEFDKCIKYILLNDSITSLTNLYTDFYNKDDSYLNYEKVLASVFNNYEEGIINDDYILENEEDGISEALEESVDVQSEVRVVEILECIRFLEKKRIAILIGASGAGKSMFLCHATADYLKKVKDVNRKHIIFYFTFENSKAETFLRIVANMVNIPIDTIKENIRDPKYKKEIINKYLSLKDKNTILVISELPPKRHSMATLEAITDKVLLKYKDAEVYAAMVDYVDKMIPMVSNKNLRTDESLGLIVDDFKAYTKKYDTCGITVSQFNRDGAKKARGDEEMATGADIGGGWSKYENADIVITMHVKIMFEELGYNTVILVNEKHRYYRNGTVIHAIYQPQYAKFKLGTGEEGGAMQGTFQKTNNQVDNDIYKNVAAF